MKFQEKTMVLFGCKEEGRKSCLARKSFWEMKTAVTSGCSGIEQKFPSAHEGLKLGKKSAGVPLEVNLRNPFHTSQEAEIETYCRSHQKY